MSKSKRATGAQSGRSSANPRPALAAQQRARLLRDGAFVLALTALVWGVNAAWLWLDSRPPVWDMAMHQSYALNYMPGRDPAPGPFWTWSGIYPPLVHLLVAFNYIVIHPGPPVAAWANLSATLLLFWGVLTLGSDLAGPGAGRWACILTALTPYLLWMSRETVLDYWLSAWVVCSLVILRRTQGFARRKQCALLGLLSALGMLTKWLFAAFLFFPVVYVALRGMVWKDRNRSLNLILAALICCLVAGLWYFPNLKALAQYFPENARIGELEGEPPVLSFQSLIYYLRLLEGYQLFLVLFMLLVISMAAQFKSRVISDSGYLGITVAGAWLVLTLIRTKDPRFSLPLLGLLAIIPGAWIQSWKGTAAVRTVKALLLLTLVFQAYMVNFGISWLPEEVVLARGYQGSLRWDWNLYLQHYFHILGPPRSEDWKHAEILRRMDRDAAHRGLRRALALVPDLPRFNASNFHLYARLTGIDCQVGRLVLTPEGIFPLDAVDYVLTVEGHQGMSWTTAGSSELTRIINESALFQLVDRFRLPEGNYSRLYRVQHPAKTAGK